MINNTNFYINESNIDKRMIPFFREPVAKKKIELSKFQEFVPREIFIVNNVEPFLVKLQRIKKKLLIYNNLIIKLKKEKNGIDFLNDNYYTMNYYYKESVKKISS